jgi:hypothetical protein
MITTPFIKKMPVEGKKNRGLTTLWVAETFNQ